MRVLCASKCRATAARLGCSLSRAELLGRTGVAINVAAGAALNFMLVPTRWCIVAFVVSNLMIAYSAQVQQDAKIVWMQMLYFGIGLFGIYNWFGGV